MRRLLLLVAAGWLAPAIPEAQTLDEVVAKHVVARGGREALAALRTLSMTGRASASPGREALVTREIARPGRIRTEFVFQGTTGVYAWDGSEGWQVSPLDGDFAPRKLTAEAAALSAEQADLEGPLVDWKAKGHALELVGIAALAGGRAHELKLTLRSGAVRRVFVDAATGLVVRTESTRALRGHAATIETDFAEHRETGGVRFARSLVMGVRGRPRRLRIVVEQVEVNPALADSHFRMPR